ncbi:MAG TPA: haloacid dehalogenase-like hydrolase [Acidimicrobiales bacterium]|nr:haloacid dehalogenase-like hydrolase [Acidimicrobiales bacterium]
MTVAVSEGPAVRRAPGRRLVLWDIDGTLVSCGGAAREALETGAAIAAGLDQVPDVVMSGKTDPQIVLEILQRAGVAPQRAELLLPEALAEAERALEQARPRLEREGRVHRGVRELLHALSDTPGVRQTVVTGNISANAAVKLATFGLDAYVDMDVGAYGSDDRDRDCLVPICLGRVDAAYDEHYDPKDVWVIGDTHRDLACAAAADVRCLIVGTGREGFDAVRHLRADAVVPDLADTGAVLEILLG